MKKELHLFIIWKNAEDNKDIIIKDIKKNFKLRNIYKVIWDDDKWSSNLSRFYGTNLPNNSDKEEHCGKEYFYLIVVEDEKPKYEYRETSHGKSLVNINMFDRKTYYRELTGGGHKVHGTDSQVETNHDLTLLLGMNVEDFMKKEKPNNKIKEIKQNLIGTDFWNSLEEMFYALNNCVDYVVLRDFDNDMEEMLYNSSYDADILCDSLMNTIWTLNAEEIYVNGEVQYKTKVTNKEVYFDIKYVGDGYYCNKLEEDILKTKKYHNFYNIPNENIRYNITLLHALVHKDNYETEYNEKLAKDFPKKHDKKKKKMYYVDMLSSWMKDNDYYITVQEENPKKMNVGNIVLFDDGLYSKNIIDEIKKLDEFKRLKLENANYRRELSELKNNYNVVITSKGWRILEKIRRAKRIFRK